MDLVGDAIAVLDEIYLDGRMKYSDYNVLYDVISMINGGRVMTPLDFDGVESDPVNHPSHYTSYPGIEVIQLTMWLNFCRGNAVKYIARAGMKDPDEEIQDLEKAKWYIEKEIERINIERAMNKG